MVVRAVISNNRARRGPSKQQRPRRRYANLFVLTKYPRINDTIIGPSSKETYDAPKWEEHHAPDNQPSTLALVLIDYGRNYCAFSSDGLQGNHAELGSDRDYSPGPTLVLDGAVCLGSLKIQNYCENSGLWEKNGIK